MKNNRKNKKGFTLIEMLAAVVILGILAAIATIAINNILKSSRTKSFVATYDNAITAAKAALMMDDTPSVSSTSTSVTVDFVKEVTGGSSSLCNTKGDYYVEVKSSTHNTNITASGTCSVANAKCGDSKLASCVNSNGEVSAAQKFK